MAKQYLGTKLQDLGNVNILDPSDKIVIVQPTDEGVMELREFFFYVQSNLDFSNFLSTAEAVNLYAPKTNVYTKSEADEKFAFIDRTYTKVQADAKYAVKNDTYTKSEIDLGFATKDNTYTRIEVYNKDETFNTFALKTEIPILPDLSPYSTTFQGDARWAMKADTYSKIISDARFAPLDKSYSKTEEDARFAKVLTTYTKEETDAKFLDNDEGYTRTFIQNNIYFKTEVYTKLEAETRYALKSNVYTIAAVNDQFAAKSWVYSRGDAETTFAPILTTYTKTEVGSLIDSRVNPVITDLATNYYTKTNANALYATLNLTYSRLVSDAKYALLSNTMTVTALAAKYYDKLQVDSFFAALDFTPYLTKVNATATYATLALTYSKDEMVVKYYTKAEVDDAIAAAKQGLETTSDQRYITAGFADGRYANITSVYTKAESDNTYATKALTYSRDEANALFPTKTATTSEITASSNAVTNNVTANYLSNATAANTYLTKTDGANIYATKALTYSKSEGDARYAYKADSYTKVESDGRYYALGGTVLNLTGTIATGAGPTLNLKNLSTTNYDAGRVTWSNANYELGHVRINNTSINEAEFVLTLRPNFTTLSATALKVTPTFIEHVFYGKLDTYFAKVTESYTRSVIDGLFTNVSNTYLTITNARNTYTLQTSHDGLASTVTALDSSLTAHKSLSASTYATKTEVYNRTDADARYVAKLTTVINVNDDVATITGTSGLVLTNAQAANTFSLPVTFKSATDTLGHIHFNKAGTSGQLVVLNKTSGGTVTSLRVNESSIWHALYGDLHTYFAKAVDVYTKAESDVKFSSAAALVYTKTESDTKYGLKTDLTALTGRVTTAEGNIASVTNNVNTNFYTKALSYSRTEADARYLTNLTNSVILTQRAGLTAPLTMEFANTGTTTDLGGNVWKKGTETYTLKLLLPTANTGKLSYSSVAASVITPIFEVDGTLIWHKAYGDLHTYFAKAVDTYTKVDVDSFISTVYANTYTPSVIESKLTTLGSSHYLKTETYTRTEMDTRYALVATSYTKTETDTKYGLKTDVAANTSQVAINKTDIASINSNLSTNYYAKSLVYTKAESDAVLVSSVTNGTITGSTTAGDTVGLFVKNNNVSSILYGGLTWYQSTTRKGGLYMEYTGAGVQQSALTLYLGATATIDNLVLKADTVGIWSKPYGDLHTYFAKAVDVYAKTLTYSSAEANALFELKNVAYTKAASDAKYPLKTDSYTKAEGDGKYELINTAYAKAVSDGRYAYKADSYTKAESDGKYPLIINTYGKVDVYTKTEGDGRYAYKADSYTKVESDGKYPLKTDSYTKAEGDAKYPLITNTYAKTEVYTKVEADGKYPLKTDSYTKAVSDATYPTKTASYTRAESDAKYPLITNTYAKTEVYTKVESDGKYPLKTDTYTMADVYTKVQGDGRYVYKSDLGTDVSLLKSQNVREAAIVTTGNIVIGVGTYTIAYGLNRTMARIIVADSTSPTHVQLDFSISISFGASPNIIVNNFTSFGAVAATIPAIEVAYGGTYDGIVVRLVVATALNNGVKISLMDNVGADAYNLLSVPVLAGSVAEQNAIAPSMTQSSLTNTIRLPLLQEGGVHVSSYLKSASGLKAGDWVGRNAQVDGSSTWWLNGAAVLGQLTVSTDVNPIMHAYLTGATGGHLSYFQIQTARLWHRAYGFLDDYFAKSSDSYVKSLVYSKVESDAKYPLKTDSYTKAEGDARYAYKADAYTKAEADAKYPLITNTYGKVDVYTKVEADAKYPLKTASYTKAEGDALYPLKTASYTKSESDLKYPLITNTYTKTEVYTRVESDAKYPLIANTYSKTEGDTRYILDGQALATLSGNSLTGADIGLVIANIHTTTDNSASLVWTVRSVKSAEIYISGGSTTNSQYNLWLRDLAGTWTSMFYTSYVGIWHKTYGLLHTYFALASDTYTKAQGDARYAYKADAYTKAEADAKYPLIVNTYGKVDVYTKVEADAKYPLKTDSYTRAEGDAKYEPIDSTYTKAEADAKYPLITNTYGKVDVYTKVEADAKYPLKTASYTKAEADAKYEPIDSTYTKAEADAKYPLKTASYTKAEGDAKYPLLTNPGTMGIGIGQTWQNVKSSRLLEVTYTNSTGRAIAVAVYATSTRYSDAVSLAVTINGVSTYFGSDVVAGYTTSMSGMVIIPENSNYVIDMLTYTGVKYNGTVLNWTELR